MRTDWQAPATGGDPGEGQARNALRATLDTLVATMTAAGIARATVPYDGVGDSGTVDAPTFLDAAGHEVEAPAALHDQVVAWVEDALPGGWDIDSGSTGTATIDPAATPRVRFDHAWRSPSRTPAPFTVRGAAAAARLRRRRGRGEDIQEDDQLDGLCAALRALGVASIHVTYSGCGDEGYVDDVGFEPTGVAVPDEIRSQIEDWVCDQLPPGWEIGEGAQGGVTIGVDRPLARFDHEDVIELCEDDPLTFD
jgi:hypothetical protein